MTLTLESKVENVIFTKSYEVEINRNEKTNKLEVRLYSFTGRFQGRHDFDTMIEVQDFIKSLDK